MSVKRRMSLIGGLLVLAGSLAISALSSQLMMMC